MIKKVMKWKVFSAKVEDHIANYVVPQYGDDGEDPAVEYTVADCVKQAQRYLARSGRSSRPGEEERDMLKAAHWISIAAEKMGND